MGVQLKTSCCRITFIRLFQKKQTYKDRKRISGCLGLRVGVRINFSFAQGIFLEWCKCSKTAWWLWLHHSMHLLNIIEAYNFNEHISWCVEYLNQDVWKMTGTLYSPWFPIGSGLLKQGCYLGQGCDTQLMLSLHVLTMESCLRTAHQTAGAKSLSLKKELSGDP